MGIIDNFKDAFKRADTANNLDLFGATTRSR